MASQHPYDMKMVVLPVLNASTCLTLGRQLLSTLDAWAEAGHPIPELVAYARGKMAAAVDALAVALQPLPSQDTAEAQDADRALDATWSAFRDWLAAFVSLAEQGVSGLEKAVALYNLLFSEGLSFTQSSYKEEHAESQARLDAIVENRHEETIASLRGEPFYDAVKQAHVHYGEVLGITNGTESVPSVDLRAPFGTLRDAIRDYVLKVAAQVRDDQPETEQAREALLVPLTEWDGHTTGATGEDTEPETAQEEAQTPAPPEGT